MKEKLVFVTENGVITRFSESKIPLDQEYLSVVLILVYLQDSKEIALFNRASGASDMHNHWALTAGKINADDIATAEEALAGKPLSFSTITSCALREFNEELNVSISGQPFELITQFTMPTKKMYFSMLGWGIAEHDLKLFSPDGQEVGEIGRFSIDSLKINQELGDAIVYKLPVIVEYLNTKFNNQP